MVTHFSITATVRSAFSCISFIWSPWIFSEITGGDYSFHPFYFWTHPQEMIFWACDRFRWGSNIWWVQFLSFLHEWMDFGDVKKVSILSWWRLKRFFLLLLFSGTQNKKEKYLWFPTAINFTRSNFFSKNLKPMQIYYFA